MSEPAPSPGLARAVTRAIALRCPRCGEGGTLAGWFRLNDACRRCKLPLRRAPDADDEWFGGYFMNLIASESLMLVVVVGYVLWRWPAVPWTTVEWLAVVMVFVSPVMSYPFAKMLWVAVEFVFAERAVTRSRRP